MVTVLQILILEGPPAAGDGSKQGSTSRSSADPPVHRRTRSSNTQLPPLDEHAVLSDPGLLPSVVQAPCTLPAATRPGADVFGGLQHLGSDMWGWGGSGHQSRRSSRADSEGSSGADSSAGGLVCEPSTFGVCADPAGGFCCAVLQCCLLSYCSTRLSCAFPLRSAMLVGKRHFCCKDAAHRSTNQVELRLSVLRLSAQHAEVLTMAVE